MKWASCQFCSSPSFPRLAGDPRWTVGNTPQQKPYFLTPTGTLQFCNQKQGMSDSGAKILPFVQWDWSVEQEQGVPWAWQECFWCVFLSILEKLQRDDALCWINQTGTILFWFKYFQGKHYPCTSISFPWNRNITNIWCWYYCGCHEVWMHRANFSKMSQWVTWPLPKVKNSKIWNILLRWWLTDCFTFWENLGFGSSFCIDHELT